MRLFTFLAILFFGFVGTAQTVDDFVFEIDLTTTSPSYQFEITGTGTINIDWGDGTTNMYIDPVAQVIGHSYSSMSLFTVIISDPLQSFKINQNYWRTTPLNIVQWGNSQWQTMHRVFENCENLTISAMDSPDLSQLTDMSFMFNGSTNFNSDISNWNVSNVTNMSVMFQNAISFNQPLNNWDVSSVTSMGSMFRNTNSFNQPLNNWDVSSVTNMSNMFQGTQVFNQPIDNWDVSSVTNMSSMFRNSNSFNQPINNWNVSSVTNMGYMFETAQAFNQSLNGWDITSVVTMDSMFRDNSTFNNSIDAWDMSNVPNLSFFFRNSTFNQPLDSWDMSNYTDLSYLFWDALNFNQPLNSWDVSNVTNMAGMFRYAVNFNQPLNNWDVSSVVSMVEMFVGTTAFNQPLNNWDVSSVISMVEMFDGATAFNQPLNNWDVSSVILMRSMFRNSTAFNQPIDAWDVSSVNNMKNMFKDATAFNQPLNSWDISNVGRIEYMFKNAIAFNQPLNDWDISRVFGLPGVFENAVSFNQPLGNWDVSNINDFQALFKSAVSFNQDLSVWNFRSYFTLEDTFSYCGMDSINYDKLLRKLVFVNSLVIGNQHALSVHGLEYCDIFSRSILIQRGWQIIGDSQSTSCPDNILSGSILYDFDLNGCAPSDLESQNVGVHIVNGTNDITVYTYNGQYSVNLPDGTYTVTSITNNNLFSGTPASVNVTMANGNAVTQDFCLTATSPIDDLEVTILPLEDARPGFDTNYKLVYKNKGNTRLSGSVDFTYQDDFMDFLTATPATTSSSVGMLSWDFIDLDPFETREIEFSMNLNTPTDPTFPLNSNDLLDFNATINPTTNDDTPLDNVFDLQQTVVNSYDPNDKTCLQGETILPTMVGEYVHYRIRFENEGTASAITVRIVDYIDTTKFDIATLIPLSGSHDYTTTITESNKVEFLFDNIMLPFTAPASQGYVLFKIKTVDTLVLGDDFSNQAEIYFDFNSPIITNLETTAVAVPLSLNESNLFQASLFPNPAQNSVSVTSNLEFHQYTIYNTLGAVVSQQKLESPALSHDIQVNHLVSGLYFVELRGDQGSFVVKLIKE